MLGLLYRAADALRRRAYRGDHGRIGEDLAHRYLRRQGCAIVARNYRPPAGGVEIDIVHHHVCGVVGEAHRDNVADAHADVLDARRRLDADRIRLRDLGSACAPLSMTNSSRPS